MNYVLVYFHAQNWNKFVKIYKHLVLTKRFYIYKQNNYMNKPTQSHCSSEKFAWTISSTRAIKLIYPTVEKSNKRQKTKKKSSFSEMVHSVFK